MIIESGGLNKTSQLPPVKFSGIMTLTVVVVEDAGSPNAGVARGRPGDGARCSDGPLCIKVLEIEYRVNEGLSFLIDRSLSSIAMAKPSIE